VKPALAVLVPLLCALPASADSIHSISNDLTHETSVPLAPGVAMELASNIWVAHETTPYALVEKDSLELSIDAVLRAIYLSGQLDGATEIVNEQLTPLPWLQSEIAIDDRVSVTITPDSLDFGSVPVPEPSTLTLALSALDALLLFVWYRRPRV
jgi:hypothetical protein